MPPGSPPSPGRKPDLTPALERNITALMNRRQDELQRASFEERLAERITRFTGTMLFVYIHLAFFGAWIAINVGLVPFIPRWDPTLVILAMEASVEAIFLSTFVLISQNRMAGAADKRADLNLQISLLDEHETTKLITLVAAIADRLGVSSEVDPELEELKKDVVPEAVLDRIQQNEKNYK